MSSFGSQNQRQLSLAHLGELLKAIMLLSNFNGFNLPSYPFEQRFMQKKAPPSKPPVWKEKDSKWSCHFLFFLLVCLFLSQSSFYWFLICLFVVLFPRFNKKRENLKNTKTMCVFLYTGTCIPCMVFKTKFLTLYHL